MWGEGGGGAVVTARNGILTPATLHRESNVLTAWPRHPYRGLPARIKVIRLCEV